MARSDIYRNEYICIFKEMDSIFIESYKKGFSLELLNNILSTHTEFDITNETVLRFAINYAPRPPQQFGSMKERIVVEIEDSDLTAFITYNLKDEDLDLHNREALMKETFSKLKERGIVLGIKNELFFGPLKNSERYLIAQGIPPIHGTDCIIKMYEIKEAKPEVREDGKVDFYELKLINKVKAGDWLGERIEATEGMPGQTVRGISTKPTKGKTFPLNYDRNTVQEVFENGKTVLYSKINGAVHYVNDKIVISNHLEIDGDIDFKTGNIKFDGYLTIRGTVADGFTVEATKDVEITAPMGVGNVKSIISTEGSVFIQGGMTSKGKSEVHAAKQVFMKYVDNAKVICCGNAHFGFYCVNSIVTAKEVIIDSPQGHIIGGTVTAEIKVQTPILGSDMEKRTIIEITGFNRTQLKEDLDSIFQKISDLKNEQQKLKQLLATLEAQGQLNKFQSKEYNDNLKRLADVKDETKDLEDKRKNIANYLKARGEGEINITKKLYPNCMLNIRKNILEIASPSLATCMYFQDGEIKQS